MTEELNHYLRDLDYAADMIIYDIDNKYGKIKYKNKAIDMIMNLRFVEGATMAYVMNLSIFPIDLIQKVYERTNV